MKPALQIFIIAAVIFINGCATSYHSTGFTGGYSETQLAPDVFRIHFAGNGYTSGERAQDFAMLRAADLTLQHGFKCFAIIDESSSTAVSSFTTPGSATTTGSAYVSGGYGNYYGSYSDQTTYTPPQTYYVFKPRAGLLIRCFTDKPEAIYTFDAAFLQQSLKQKYHITTPAAGPAGGVNLTSPDNPSSTNAATQFPLTFVPDSPSGTNTEKKLPDLGNEQQPKHFTPPPLSSRASTSKFSSSASGTGFFVTDDGFLVTCAHVVKGAMQIRLSTSEGLINAKMVSVDAANDLALLKAEGKFSPLPIAASRTVNLGSTVATIGFPDIELQGFAPKLAKGEIAALSGAADDPRHFQISVPVQPGNSGGALVDERGNVVGVVSAKLDASVALAASGALPENVNYAVKSSFLLSFLESMPDAKLKTANTNDEKFEDVVKSAQRATVLVSVMVQEPQTVLSAPPQPRPVPYKSIYSGVNSSHTLDGVMDDGNLIKLDDDSLWQVSPYDVIDSALWLPPSDITVIEGNDPGYPYKLVNTDDSETVNARLIRE